MRYKVSPDFDHVCVFVRGCMFLCIMCVAGYKQAYLSRQMDVAEVKKALTERILMHDRAEKEVSVTASTGMWWVCTLRQKIALWLLWIVA